MHLFELWGRKRGLGHSYIIRAADEKSAAETFIYEYLSLITATLSVLKDGNTEDQIRRFKVTSDGKCSEI